MDTASSLPPPPPPGRVPLLRFQFVSGALQGTDPAPWHRVCRVPGVDALVVAGELGRVAGRGFREFLGRACDEFPRVLLVPGDAEHHLPADERLSGDDGARRELRAMAADHPGLAVLWRDPVAVRGVRFLSVTLWSHEPDAARPHGAAYHHTEDEGWVQAAEADAAAWHEEQLARLDDVLRESPVVVAVTHFAPVPAHLAPRYARRTLRVSHHALHADLPRLARRPVVCWVSGHAHQAHSIRIREDGVLCVANPMVAAASGYDPGRVVAVHGGISRGGAACGSRAEEEGRAS